MVKILDQDIKTMRPDAIANLGVARTFQNIELFENMTTLDNILIGAHRHINYGSIAGLLFSKKARKEEEKARKIAEDIIDFLEIEEYRYSYILSLPYGIQKRIELARALAMKPKILLLDEPAAGMNNEETEDIARFILDIHEELGVTVVLIDHDMNMVMDIATEVIVMDFGKKLFDGNPTEASKNKNVIEAYLGVSE
jgi:branched-chain amino acid transport system ATP-binding protein